MIVILFLPNPKSNTESYGLTFLALQVFFVVFFRLRNCLHNTHYIPLGLGSYVKF
jgi:hypothetical protein